MIDLKELKTLLDKATPGEWSLFHGYDSSMSVVSAQRLIRDDWTIQSTERWSAKRSEGKDNLKLICALHNNAKELMRLAKFGMTVEGLLKESFGEGWKHEK